MELATSAVTTGKERYFVGIMRDITERKHVEQMQKEFVSTVSHELRTPLTSIRGSLGLILGGVAGELPQEAITLLTIANSNSKRLIHLINDMLDIEKISAGKMEFDFKVADLIPFIEQAVELNRPYGEQLNVRFKMLEVSHRELMVNFDEKLMAQVLSNLLSNAAKLSPTDDEVEISIERSYQQVRICVHDNGQGIPEEFKGRVFSKLAQADSSNTRQKGGTGLGLSITKSIVERHQGTINFDSGEGIGTTFYVDLPLWVEKKPFEPSGPR
ncbi:MAG: signal transduction histidine kinase [Myxococcota bacterium]|jgi:signal transduction histidine kinase